PWRPCKADSVVTTGPAGAMTAGVAASRPASGHGRTSSASWIGYESNTSVAATTAGLLGSWAAMATAGATTAPRSGSRPASASATVAPGLGALASIGTGGASTTAGTAASTARSTGITASASL